MDEHTEPEIYQRTLANALADSPDFHIELGDTFMTEKHPNREAAFKQYLAQRYYAGQTCHSAPFFFVLGNTMAKVRVDAAFYEWGGRNADGSDGFKENNSWKPWILARNGLVRDDWSGVFWHDYEEWARC